MGFRDTLGMAIIFLGIAISAALLVGVTYWSAERLAPDLALPPIVEAVGITFSGLALVGLIYSISVQTKSIEAETGTSVAARQIEIDTIFIERPWLRPYFLENAQAQPDDENYQEILAAAALLANYFETWFAQRGLQKQLYADDQWLAYMMTHIERSQVLRDFVLANPSWYSKRFVALIAECKEKSEKT